MSKEPNVFAAMMFARHAHGDQKRKYTGVPYTDHLAEVAGITASVAYPTMFDTMICTAWLHDVVEDTKVEISEIRERFGFHVAHGVSLLSDLNEGTRVERKQAYARSLSTAPGWVQTVKCADLISNTGSILQFDPVFAKVYLAEKRHLLTVMTKANAHLHALATTLAQDPEL